MKLEIDMHDLNNLLACLSISNNELPLESTNLLIDRLIQLGKDDGLEYDDFHKEFSYPECTDCGGTGYSYNGEDYCSECQGYWYIIKEYIE